MGGVNIFRGPSFFARAVVAGEVTARQAARLGASRDLVDIVERVESGQFQSREAIERAEALIAALARQSLRFNDEGAVEKLEAVLTARSSRSGSPVYLECGPDQDSAIRGGYQMSATRTRVATTSKVITGEALAELVKAGFAKIRSQMLPVPGGTFNMGYDGPGAEVYEKPVRRVTVASFTMSKNDVTNSEYQEWVASLGERRFFSVSFDQRGWPQVVAMGTREEIEAFNRGREGLQFWEAEAYDPYENLDRPKQPVNVNRRSAQLYALMHGVRLATGAEAEYAASEGGKKREYSPAEIYTRHQDRNRNSTIDVEDPSYADGPYGLRHLMGNVSKWLMDDQWNLYGASWVSEDPAVRRVSSRLNRPLVNRRHDVGFRLVGPEDSLK